MTEFLSSMLWPFLACLVLVGIHAYLGIHIIARKVIFVDLALAQIAALGATFGVFLGLSFEQDNFIVKLVSVLFTFLGAILFSLTRTRHERVPHEAIIGIIYAAALSSTILLTAHLPHGAEEVSQMLAGSILWVEPKTVLMTAVLYGGIGLIHWIFRKPFFSLSDEEELKKQSPNSIRFWDFCFYATFGLVVTSSVTIGGVLLVFGFLVIPSVIGICLAKTLKKRLFLGWGIGALVSLLGVIISYHWDLPSGPTIVVALASVLFLVGLIKQLNAQGSRHRFFFHLLWALPVMALVLLWSKDLRKPETHQVFEANLKETLLDSSSMQKLEALKEIAFHRKFEYLPEVRLLLSDERDEVREQAIQTLRYLKDEKNGPAFLEAGQKETDEFLQIEMAEGLMELGIKEGLSILLKLMENSPTELVRAEAFDRFTAHVNEVFSFDPKNAQQSVGPIHMWLKKNVRYFSSKMKFGIQ